MLAKNNVNSATSASLNKFVGKLTTVPPRKTLESHLNYISERRTAYNSFTSAMQYPIKLLEDRYSKLDLEGRPVTVLPYANEEDCKIITDALK